MNPPAPAAVAAHRLFRQHYGRRLELALVIGLLFHVALFSLVPPMVPETASHSREPSILVLSEPPPGIEIQPLPPEVPRPSLEGLDLASVVEVAPPPVASVGPADVPDPFPTGDPGVALRRPPFVARETRPVILRAVEPTYPRLAQEAGAQGPVWVEVLVDRQGQVIRARVLRSEVPRILEEAALAAARDFLFRPALQQGYAVPATVVLPFQFTLR